MHKQISTKELIKEKFIEMMEDRPFYKIKVAHFVQFVGISRSTFYFYFDSTDSVLETIEDEFIAGLVEENRLNQKFKEKTTPALLVASVLFSSVEYLRKNLKVYRILSGPHGSTTFQLRFAERIMLVVDRIFLSFDLIESELERKMIREYVAGGQVYLLNWWIEHEEEVDVEELFVFDVQTLNNLLGHH